MKKKLVKEYKGELCEECGRHVMSVYASIKGKVKMWLCWACFNNDDE